MPQNYVPIFIFMAVIGVLLPITLLAAKLVRPDNPSKTKLMPYECGIDPIDNARGRYTVRYYIIAILFVVFDVETIFLFPWAVKFKALGVFGLVEILIFLVILIVGYIWVWGKGRVGMGVTPATPAAEPSAETFAASRWTQGNFIFPTRIIVSPMRVSRVKSRWFGKNEESIPISKVASVHISTGVLWAEIIIESTGGTDPITSHGHRKRTRNAFVI